jgi:hypothetical protein
MADPTESDDDEEATYGLVLPFDSDDPEFARGMTCGMIWERLKHEPYRLRQQVRSDCSEMILRIAEATGRHVHTVSDTDDWLDVEFGEST